MRGSSIRRKTAYTSNRYYDEYKKTGEINEGIWLTGKDDNRFPGHESLKSFYDFKDAALKAEAERAEKVAKADAIIDAAKNAVEKVDKAKADVAAAASLKRMLEQVGIEVRAAKAFPEDKEMLKTVLCKQGL